MCIRDSLIPGGVNSPVRAFRAVGGEPVFIARGEGAYLYGADGTKYVDYVGSWGPLILGHAHPDVVAAICKAAALGTTFGAPTELEVRFAEEDVYKRQDGACAERAGEVRRWRGACANRSGRSFPGIMGGPSTAGRAPLAPGLVAAARACRRTSLRPERTPRRRSALRQPPARGSA